MPAKHTKQSFYDQQAISFVSAWIAETQRAMPDLKANDKWPNIDGYIEVTDENGYPKGTLKVQVKKLSVKNAQKKQYSFKDDKFLSYCRESADGIPTLFIGVDLKNNKAFWLHMDHDFLNKNGGKKTIKLTESQVIKSGKEDFIKDWESIIAIYDSKNEEFEKYKKAFSILSDVINPALGKTDDKFIKIHYFIDEINNYLDNKFPIIKQIFYPKTWKLGFAYYQYEKSKLVYTLYPIAWNRNDVQIKEVDKNLHDKIQKEGLGFTGYFFENPLETQPKEHANEIIELKIKEIIKARLLKHTGSDFLAREFIFAFIDKFHVQMGLEQKDEYLIDEIEKSFYSYLPFWLKISHDILLLKDRNNFKNRAANRRMSYFNPDIIGEIENIELEEINKKVKEAFEKNISAPQIPMGNEQIPFGLFVEFLNFLKQTKNKVVRIYKIKDFSRLKNNNNFVWSVFSRSNLDYNLKAFFIGLLDVYETVLQNNFPFLKGDLSLFGEADTILVYWNAKDVYNDFQDGPTYEMYYLKSRINRVDKKIFLLTDEEATEMKDVNFTTKDVNFRGKKYQITFKIKSVLDFIYNDTPMLDFVYKEIKSSIENYLKNNNKVKKEV